MNINIKAFLGILSILTFNLLYCMKDNDNNKQNTSSPKVFRWTGTDVVPFSPSSLHQTTSTTSSTETKEAKEEEKKSNQNNSEDSKEKLETQDADDDTKELSTQMNQIRLQENSSPEEKILHELIIAPNDTNLDISQVLDVYIKAFHKIQTTENISSESSSSSSSASSSSSGAFTDNQKS